MLKTRTYFSNHHLNLSESKSKLMSYDATTGKTIFQGSSTLPPLTLSEVLQFKYLGVPLGCSPYSLFKSFNQQVCKRAKDYLSRVLSLTKRGPDRCQLSFTLWTQVALPSILYGTEVIPITDTTIKEVEKCNAKVGKYILQIPASSANVCANIDAGLRPIWSIIAEKVLLYSHSVMSKPESNWAKLAMTENLTLGNKSPYFRYLMKWKKENDVFDLPPKGIKKNIRKTAITYVTSQQKITGVTTFSMNFPGSSKASQWFRPRPWVSDSGISQILSLYRSCNLGLGNRGPCMNGMQYKLCPLCSKNGVKALNNEVVPH